MAVVGSRHPLVIEGMSMDAPISGSGAAAVVISSATIAASAYFALGSHPCPLLLLGTFYAAGAAEIIVLCRVTVPNWLQAVLILLIIATLTTLTARTDVFGVRHASARRYRSWRQATSMRGPCRPRPAAQATRPPSRPPAPTLPAVHPMRTAAPR